MPTLHHRSLHVLLIEDDPDDRLLMQRQLTDPGSCTWKVTAVRSLAEARPILVSGDFDIVLTDLNLPDGDATSTIRSLRAVMPLHPIVVLTGMNDEAVGLAAIQAGAQDYLQKGRTERTLLRRTLLYAVERLRTETFNRSVVSVLAEGVIVQDAESRIVTSNPSAERILGFAAGEILGRTSFDPSWKTLRANGETFPPHDHPVTTTLRTGVPAREVVMGVVRPDDSVVWISINTEPIFEPGQKAPSLVVCSFHDVTAQRAAEKQVRASLSEKDLLLREVHHRVKNNMQVISSLLSLQAMQVEDEAIRTLFDDSQYRIRTMALIHERLYQSGDLARVDFPEYLRTLVKMIFRSHQPHDGVTFEVSVEPLPINIDTAIPLGLITNELIVNALKHAFGERRVGKVVVQLREVEGSEYEFVVSDDGLAPKVCTIPRPSEGLGMRLVEVLVRQIKGQLTTDLSSGSRFVIRFPAPPIRT